MKRINIIRWDNASGLSRSARILYRVLHEAGFLVTINGPQAEWLHKRRFQRTASSLYTQFRDLKNQANLAFNHNILHRHPYDINIFIEDVRPEWFPYDLEQKIDKVLGMDNSLKQQLGENARDWYQQNEQFFKHRIVEIIKNI